MRGKFYRETHFNIRHQRQRQDQPDAGADSRLWKDGKRSAVIVNEDGAVDYEPEFIQDKNVWVTYLRGG